MNENCGCPKNRRKKRKRSCESSKMRNGGYSDERCVTCIGHFPYGCQHYTHPSAGEKKPQPLLLYSSILFGRPSVVSFSSILFHLPFPCVSLSLLFRLFLPFLSYFSGFFAVKISKIFRTTCSRSWFIIVLLKNQIPIRVLNYLTK